MRLGLEVILLLAAAGARAQNDPISTGIYDATSTYSFAIAGTAPSHNIFSGLADGRTLLMLTGDWDHQIHQGRKIDYRWEVEVLPVVEMTDPRERTKTIITTAAGTFVDVNDFLPLSPCKSYSQTSVYLSGPPGYPAGPGTVTYTQLCSTEWDYLGGVSPLGQRVSWRPGKRLQPYWIANAGFLAATKSVPMFDAARFNFTAETGAGLEWFVAPRRSLAFDVRYHHMSNGGRADNNPGVDSIAFRATYRFGRR